MADINGMIQLPILVKVVYNGVMVKMTNRLLERRKRRLINKNFNKDMKLGIPMLDYLENLLKSLIIFYISLKYEVDEIPVCIMQDYDSWDTNREFPSLQYASKKIRN